jgi:hypothetical protein
MLTPQEVTHYILSNFSDIVPMNSWGEQSFFINPDQKLKRGTYFSTIKEKDGENDKASNLSRDGVHRLNLGLTEKTYNTLFGEKPKRPAKGKIIDSKHDFTQLDTLTPHPIYGWMGWIAVLTPSEQTFENINPLLQDAYNKAYILTQKKIKKEGK